MLSLLLLDLLLALGLLGFSLKLCLLLPLSGFSQSLDLRSLLSLLPLGLFGVNFVLWLHTFTEVIFFLKIFDPWVIKYFDERQPVRSLVLQDGVDEVLVLVGEPRLEPDDASGDLVADLSGVHTREGSSTVDELVQKDAEGPNVQSVVMSLVLDHFWSHVLGRSTEGVPLLVVVALDAPSKVAYLDDVALFDQNVLWLDVSVDQSLLVHIVNA